MRLQYHRSNTWLSFFTRKGREFESDICYIGNITVSILTIGFIFLGTHLFVKVPRPGNSEVTFSVF